MTKHLRFLLGCVAVALIVGCEGKESPQPDTVVSVPPGIPAPSTPPNLNEPQA
ncbi:MAG: hypothetical protein RIR26_2963, partial [Pseudomonadota bacterium]